VEFRNIFVIFPSDGVIHPYPTQPSACTPFLSLLFLGGFTARLLNLYDLLGNSLNRDKAVKQLEDIVAGRPCHKRRGEVMLNKVVSKF